MDKDHFLVTKTLDTYHNGVCGKKCMTHEFARQMSPFPFDTAMVTSAALFGLTTGRGRKPGTRNAGLG